MSDLEELEFEAEFERQREEWEAHTKAMHAQGKCEYSGEPMKQCALGICDCGLGFVADADLDAVIGRVLRGEE